jgi:GNAT superfamily N-acetyltransferase
MHKPEYKIRPMNRSEVELCTQWASAEGWNPGKHDDQAFYAADPEGFWVGLLDGEPISTISAVRYGDDFGFIGLYIVRPEYRGLGYGLKLWQVAMQHLHGRLIGLDGVVAQQANYKKNGFKFAYNNIRYQGIAGPSQAPSQTLNLFTDMQVLPVSAVSNDWLVAYDRNFFPQSRERFLTAWIGQPGVIARVVMIDDMVRGFGVIRPCETGYKIGPLFADEESIAQQLFDTLLGSVQHGTQIQFDIPAINSGARALAERHGMTPVFETARMYTGEAPKLDIARIYGITSFELG